MDRDRTNLPLKELGDRIARLRREKGWSQKELATRTGTKNARISKYEQGLYAPRHDVLARLAEALETTTDFLITGRGPTDDRLRALLPALESLPRELRDHLVEFLGSLVRAHHLTQLGSRTAKQTKRQDRAPRKRE